MSTIPLPVQGKVANDDVSIQVCVRESLGHAALVGDAGGGGDATGLMLWAGAGAMASSVLSGRHALFSSSHASTGSAAAAADDRASRPAPPNVVELGCGCGLVGALAARYADVAVLTDGSEDALDLARQTLAANGLSSEAVAAAQPAADESQVRSGQRQASYGNVQPPAAQAVRSSGAEEGNSDGNRPARTAALPLVWPGRDADVSHSVTQAGAVTHRLWQLAHGQGGAQPCPQHCLSNGTDAAIAPQPHGHASVVLAAECVYPSTTAGSMVGLLWLAGRLLGPQTHGAGPEGTSDDLDASPSLATLLSPPILLLSYAPRKPETSVRLLCAAEACRWQVQLVPWQLYSRSEPGLGAVVLACRPRPGAVGAPGSPPSINAVASQAEALATRLMAHATADASDGTSGTATDLSSDSGPDHPLAHVHRQLSLIFPDALPSLARLAALRLEMEQEAADQSIWAPPVGDDET